MNFEIKYFESMSYIICYPDGYVAGKRYPVLLSLHGAGTRRISTKQYQESDSFKQIMNAAKNELIIVAPHCTEDSWFDKFETLIRFAKSISEADYTVNEQLYLIGASMGGYAAWQLAISQPQLFAAIVPICVGGMYWNAARLINVAVWAFHGANDTTVYPDESSKMIEHIKKCGGDARLTIYESNAHNAWTDTFTSYEVFEWMLSHKNHNTQKLRISCQGAKEFG